jgi:aryl-alcohol dehydrogenase-like predicted oxidoreductase
MARPPFRVAVAAAPARGIGLGLAALGRPAYINLGHGRDVGHHPDPAALERTAREVLDSAWERGVRYFDAARSYGRAEQFLGRWLKARGIAAGEVVVGSKWGYRYTADWSADAEIHEIKEHSREMLERQWVETRTELGDHLDLYQIHSATLEGGVLTDEAVLDRLRRLSEAGTAIGLSTSGPAQAATIELALTVEREPGRRLFDSVQATWNLLEPSAGPALEAAADAGLAVIVKEALANGRLTDREPAIAARLATLAPGLAPDAVAIAAALQQPWSSVVLSGAATVGHLESNLRALEVDIDLTGAGPGFGESPEDYWDHRSRLPWT